MKNYILPSVALFTCVVASAQQEQGSIKDMIALFEKLQSFVELSNGATEACKNELDEVKSTNIGALESYTVFVGESELSINVADMTCCAGLFLEVLLEAAHRNEQASAQDKEKIANMIEHLSQVYALLEEEGIRAHYEKSFLQENLLAILQAVSAAANKSA